MGLSRFPRHGECGQTMPNSEFLASLGGWNVAAGVASGLLWPILNLLPNVAALKCSADGVLIQDVTRRVGILLGASAERKHVRKHEKFTTPRKSQRKPKKQENQQLVGFEVLVLGVVINVLMFLPLAQSRS